MSPENLIGSLAARVRKGVLEARTHIELFRGKQVFKTAFGSGFADERAAELLEEHPDVRRVERLEILFEVTGDEGLRQQLQVERRKLSNAQLLALTRLNERRIREALER